MRKHASSLIMLLFTLVVSSMAFGQATAVSAISGVVTDKTGAAIVGAEVTVVSVSTGTVRTVKTSGDGSYRVEALPAGLYNIKVSMSGFSAATATNLETLVNSTTTQNFSLGAGGTSEVVEVTTEAPLVDQTKTSVSQNISPSEVQELPLAGRDAANLAYLAPGVKAADSYDPTKNRYAILSVNGSDGRNVNTTVNGIDNKDNTVGGAVMQLPLEGVQEFQISTQRFSAENGRSQGAAINMITKSGTNNYHGSVFGYFRNDAFNTDEKVPNGDGTTTSENPGYSRQFFGGSAGGPFVKDKLFGFFAIERQRESQSLAETLSSYDELVLAQKAGFAAQPALSIPRPFYEWRYTGRLDYTINNRNSAYISYSSQANNSLNDQSNGTEDLTNGNFTTNHLQVANLTVNSQLSSTTINQFTFGFQYWNNLIASKISAPLITFPSPAQFGTNINVPQQSFQRKWQFKDDVSKIMGKHTFKAGVDYIWNPVEGGFFESNSTLEIDFLQNPSTILGNPGLYPQSFATPGLIGSMAYDNGDPYFLVPTKQLGFYGQDDWKITPRLTLNLGLRWDRDFNALGENDITKSRTYQELVAINSPISNPYVRRLPHDDTKDFSPRIGFAYDVTGAGKHLVRGGFGMYYGDSFQNIPLFMEQQANPTIFQAVLSLSAPSDQVPCFGSLGSWSYTPANVKTLEACLPGPSSQLAPGSIGRVIDPNYRNPVTEEFNLGYSWALNSTSVLELEYTHVLGLHENKTFNIDQKVPTGVDSNGNVILTRPLSAAFAAAGLPVLNSVRVDASVNRDRYDGINLSYHQRMSHRFSLIANYTLARAVGYDYGGGPNTGFRNYARDSHNLFAPDEFGPSFNDERHHVTLAGLVTLPKGFEFAPILQYGSARPYYVWNGTGDNTLNTGGGSLTAVVVPKSDPRNWFAYAGNDVGAQDCYYLTNNCTLARFDSLRGDPFFELDTKLAKNIKLGERINLQLVAQAFNLTNRANYGNNFGNIIDSPATFGHPVRFFAPNATFVPRAIWGEFGVHLRF